MPKPVTIEELAATPNVMGVVRASASGDLLEHTGNEAEVFGNVLVYFQQMASLIGESFGLEDLHEADIQSKSVSAVCLPFGDHTIGALLNARAKSSDAVAQLRALVTRN